MTAPTNDTAKKERPARRNVRLFVIAGLLVGLGLAIFVSPFVSGSPDGLEKVSEQQGFAGSAKDHWFTGGPFADYGVSGIGNEAVGTALSGLVGVLLTMGVGVALFALVGLARGRRAARDTPSD